MNNIINRPKIKILDENTICRIAAGEVILSAAYAIKEMVENSIDAYANNINIQFFNAGLSKIVVTDNGIGMTRDDILMALEHHATSKLQNVSDLKTITTYGFRGEALPSITSVSKCEIISATDNSGVGTLVKVEGGIIKDVKQIGANIGTKIIVSDLFYNTPVRKKFLKSEQYESSVIIDFVTRYALAHPEIKFSLYSNNNEIFITKPNSTLYEVISTIFPKEITKNLIEVNETYDLNEYGLLKILAYITPPHITKSNSRYQYYFINKRPFKNKSITKAIYSVYEKLIDKKQHPIVFLFIEFNQQFIDINIHPTKTEIAFICENKIYDAVFKTLSKALNSNNITLHNIETNDNKNNILNQINTNQHKLNIQDTTHILKEHFKNTNLNLDLNLNFNSINLKNEPIVTNNFNQSINIQSNDTNYNENLKLKIKKVVGQVFNSFIIAEDDDGLLIIDQHVAAEKVFYEKFKQILLNQDFNSQSLLMPLLYELTPIELDIVKTNQELLLKYGFDIEIFSNNSVIIRSIPNFIEEYVDNNLILDIITSKPNFINESYEKFYENIASKTACKAAIKAKTEINNLETMKILISDLAKCKNPFFCPHGRPIIIKFQLKDILSKFKRNL